MIRVSFFFRSRKELTLSFFFSFNRRIANDNEKIISSREWRTRVHPSRVDIILDEIIVAMTSSYLYTFMQNQSHGYDEYEIYTIEMVSLLILN